MTQFAAWPIITLSSFLLAIHPALAQQRADTDFQPDIPNPAYEHASGPRVAVDEAHHNFHTAGGRYAPLAGLLARDGYRVVSWSAAFTLEGLQEVDVLIISNAAGDTSEAAESLPTRSAFTSQEIEAVRRWVWEGGSLLLIADHMPSAGAAAALAAAFESISPTATLTPLRTEGGSGSMSSGEAIKRFAITPSFWGAMRPK